MDVPLLKLASWNLSTKLSRLHGYGIQAGYISSSICRQEVRGQLYLLAHLKLGQAPVWAACTAECISHATLQQQENISH